MKRIAVFVTLAVIFAAVNVSARSIAASQALDYIKEEYFYEITEEELDCMDRICDEDVNEEAIEKIVLMLDEYSVYYNSEYCRNILPENAQPDMEYVNVGKEIFVKINTFAENTGKAFLEIWKNINEDDKIYIDLRDCKGGFITSMLEIAACFFDKGPICTAEYKNYKQTYEIYESFVKIPPENLFVLVSHNTASAAEIFSGAVKAKKMGTVLGNTNTFGKTSIQKLVSLKSGGIMKFTIGKYSICGFDDISDTGLTPDAFMPALIEKLP